MQRAKPSVVIRYQAEARTNLAAAHLAAPSPVTRAITQSMQSVRHEGRLVLEAQSCMLLPVLRHGQHHLSG